MTDILLIYNRFALDLYKLTMEITMSRWRFIGITDTDQSIRIDNPAIPIICGDTSTKDIAVDLVLKHERRYGLWFRHVFCECIDRPELSYTI
jgi:hypothetical protein